MGLKNKMKIRLVQILGCTKINCLLQFARKLVVSLGRQESKHAGKVAGGSASYVPYATYAFLYHIVPLQSSRTKV